MTQDIFFLGITLALSVGVIYIYLSKMNKAKKMRQQAMDTIEENKEKYRHLDYFALQNASNGHQTHVILYHLMAKEDEYYEIEEPAMSFYEYLTKPQRKIYGVYLLERELANKGSIEKFMESDGASYLEDLYELFDAISTHEIKECLKEAVEYYRFSIGESEVENTEGQYPSYNLTDFKEEIMALVRQESFIKSIDNYILENANQYCDIKEETDERTSD